jgi:hypothetical protein
MKVRSDLVVENAEGELIVLDKDGGKVHQLNQSAALIWSSLGEGLGADEIAKLLTDAFEVEHERAISDVQAAVAQFTELGLLEG